MRETLKKILVVVGAGLGVICSVIGIILVYLTITVAPFIIIIWVIWKLFFN